MGLSTGRRRRSPDRGRRLASSLTTRTGEDSGIGRASVRRLTVRGVALLVVLVIVAIVALQGNSTISAPGPGPIVSAPRGDPLTYHPGSDAELARRAAAGSAQPLFTKSPGGAMATAARVARFVPLIDAAARGTGIPPTLLEGLVFLESAGRQDAVAGGSVLDAAGLTQILPGTASLLGLRVNPARSGQLLAALQTAQRAGATRRAARLQGELERADQRFDPARALKGTVRYLQVALRDLGRLDLAVAAYHAGVGNIQSVLSDYDGGRPVSYEQLYFDTAPDDHAQAWKLLTGLGDDSSRYLWRVLEAEQLMRLYRADPRQLQRLAELETGYPSTALTLVPRASFPPFASPQALSDAYQSGALEPLPRDPSRLHLVYSAEMGSLARRLGVPAGLYRGLRPAALTMLIEIAARVHSLAGGSLTVTSTVLDDRYERRLGYNDPPGATGFSFQLLRRYSSGRQAQALQFVLDRLQSLNLIAWLRGSSNLEVTVAPDAARVLRRGL